MRGFEHKGTKYLTIKNHTFIVLNGFKIKGTPIYYQLTSNISGGIIKEYLPKNWELQKNKYNGKMIFTIYNKNYFKHKSKAEKRGDLVFIAPTFDGIEYLIATTFALPLAGAEISERNIQLAKDVYIERNQINTVTEINDEQGLCAAYIDTSWLYKIEYTTELLQERIADERTH